MVQRTYLDANAGAPLLKEARETMLAAVIRMQDIRVAPPAALH